MIHKQNKQIPIMKIAVVLIIALFSFQSPSLCMTDDDFSGIEERKGQLCKKKNSENCTDSCERKGSNIWYAGGCCQGACTQVNSLSANQGKFDEEISGFELFSSSFFRGAAYSLIPEVFRDALDSRGYYRASNVVATIIQGGMIYYNSSYVPAITGMVVRTGFSKLGFSDQVSTNVGVTVAIAASLSQKLIFSQEAVLDSMIDVAIGVSGSFSGSYLALKAKSWVYNLCGYNNSTVCEKAIVRSESN
ncbi:MAG: hypothetical protein BGO67_12500 [Alphaproteobacteria bacterium 41-28]|nr:MAG: hypothetical protein BGO67_12500 [Alphaproteobacteria bacterium 41-28]